MSEKLEINIQKRIEMRALTSKIVHIKHHIPATHEVTEREKQLNIAANEKKNVT